VRVTLREYLMATRLPPLFRDVVCGPCGKVLGMTQEDPSKYFIVFYCEDCAREIRQGLEEDGAG